MQTLQKCSTAFLLLPKSTGSCNKREVPAPGITRCSESQTHLAQGIPAICSYAGIQQPEPNIAIPPPEMGHLVNGTNSKILTSGLKGLPFRFSLGVFVLFWFLVGFCLLAFFSFKHNCKKNPKFSNLLSFQHVQLRITTVLAGTFLDISS